MTENLGDLAKAEEYYRRALEIREKLAPNSIEHAELLHELGVLQRRKGQMEAAERYLSRAVDSLESGIARLGGTQSVRSEFRAGRLRYYTDYIEVLLDRKEPELAFHVLERSRARSLLTMLAERDLVFGKDLGPEIERARKLNAAAYDRTQARLAKLNAAKDTVEIEKLQARLRELNSEREDIAERIRQTSPRFAALQYPQPLDLASTRQMLDRGTALLSYSVSENQTALFLVQPDGGQSGLSVFALPVGEKALRGKIEKFRNLIEGRNQSSQESQARAGELYDLLVKPAESLLSGSERLLFVPDGPLSFLPFAALMRNQKEYLIEWKPVHTVVSATVYAELKKLRREKPRSLTA